MKFDTASKETPYFIISQNDDIGSMLTDAQVDGNLIECSMHGWPIRFFGKLVGWDQRLVSRAGPPFSHRLVGPRCRLSHPTDYAILEIGQS
jgi:hypothetical protein